MALYIISVITLISIPIDIVVAAHLITAAVSSELKSQRGESPDSFRTVMWFVVWIAVSVIVAVAIGVVTTL